MAKKKARTPSYALKDESGKSYEIPLEGSLGILASGYKGIMLWRQKRQKHMQQIIMEKMNADLKNKTKNPR